MMDWIFFFKGKQLIWLKSNQWGSSFSFSSFLSWRDPVLFLTRLDECCLHVTCRWGEVLLADHPHTTIKWNNCYCLVTKSCPTLWPHGLQHARFPCPSLSPRFCSNSCPLSRWCHPTISFSVIPFSSGPQSFPASVFSNESALPIRLYTI